MLKARVRLAGALILGAALALPISAAAQAQAPAASPAPPAAAPAESAANVPAAPQAAAPKPAPGSTANGIWRLRFRRSGASRTSAARVAESPGPFREGTVVRAGGIKYFVAVTTP